jgi:hypothetical protein
MKWDKMIAVTAMIASIFAIVCVRDAPAEKKRIELDELIIRSARGNTAIRLIGDADGGPQIQLYDEKEKPRLSVRIIKDSPMILVGDEKANARIAIGTSKVGAELLFLLQSSPHPRIQLQAKSDESRLMMSDESHPRLDLRLQPTVTDIKLADPEGRSRIALSAYKGAGGLGIADQDGHVLVQAKVAGDDIGYFITDSKVQTRAQLGLDKTGPVLRLLDEHTKPLFSKP